MMSSVMVESLSQMEQKTKEGNDRCHAEVAIQMSVTVSRDWTEAFKKHCSVDCDDVLKKIVSKATWQSNHNVSLVPLEGTWRLEGCFCGIKEIRKALQDQIAKKQTHENGGIQSSGESDIEIENDPQSQKLNDYPETKEIRHMKKLAEMCNSTLRKVERDKGTAESRSSDQKQNIPKQEVQQHIDDDQSVLKCGNCDWNSENTDGSEIGKNRERITIENRTEVKSIQMGFTNSGYSVDRYEQMAEGKSKDVKSSDSLKPQSIYPTLAEVKNDEYSASPMHFTETVPEVRIAKNLNKDVTDSSYNLERRDDFKKEDPSKFVKQSESQQQQARHKDTSISRNDSHKESTKYAANYPTSRNSSGRQENKITQFDLDRNYALMVLPSIDIDEDVFDFLRRRRKPELSRISDKCSVFEKYKFGPGHKLAIEVKPQYHIDSVREEFRKQYEQIIIDNVKIPEGVDIASLQGFAETLVEFNDVQLRFSKHVKVCRIVGPYRETARAKEMLLDIIPSSIYEAHDIKASTNTQLNVQLTTKPKDKEPTGGSPSYCATASIVVQQPRVPVFEIINQTSHSLMLSASGLITIEVKQDDLTRIRDVDVVVSCVDNKLNVIDPLADQIMKAAGHNVSMELISHKHKLYSILPTGYLVHTSAGNFTGVKAIIHVARPQVHEFPFCDQRSRDAHRTLFLNCLNHTNDVLRMRSICLAPIGYTFYGAYMVVDSFLDAVATFASSVSNFNHLNYVQLVSNESYCTEQLIRYIKQRVGVGSSR